MQFVRKYCRVDSAGVTFSKPSLTQQRFKDESNINCIVDRYGFSGHVPLSPRKAFYGDFSNMPDCLMDVFNGYSRANDYLRQRNNSESETKCENGVAEERYDSGLEVSSQQSCETA